MKEQELRRVLSANIKRFRNRREWSQVKLAEKLGISTNFLAGVETGKSWVSPLTLVKLADTLDVEVFELFTPEHQAGNNAKIISDDVKEIVTRLVKDMSIAVNQSVSTALNQSIENVTKQYLR